MTVALPRMSLEDYFACTETTDKLHELENGELIAMPPESDLNRRIATFLLIYFAQLGIPPQKLSLKTELVVSGVRQSVRIPDLMVLSTELAAALAGATRSTVTLDMPPPRLVVEVVSPGKDNIDRDYRYKRSQYEARGIDEYWIVDPIAHQVTVFTLVNGLYESAVFEGEGAISSPLLTEQLTKPSPSQPLTAAQLLTAGTDR